MKRLFITLLLLIVAIVGVLGFSACSMVKDNIGISCVDGKIVLSPSDAVSSVVAFVDGVKQTVSSNNIIDISDFTGDKVEVSAEGYNKNGKLIEKGGSTFTIIPQVTIESKDGYYDWSASDQVIRTDYPEKQVKYYVYLNNVMIDYDGTKYEIPDGISSIKVRPYFVGVSDCYGRFSEEISKRALATPKNYSFDGTNLNWGAVDFGDMEVAYKVKLNDNECTVHTNYINLSLAFNSVFDDKEKKSSMKISVKAIASNQKYEDSLYSTEQIFSCLDMVQNVRLSDGVVEWNAVDYADSYLLMVDNGNEILVENATSYSGVSLMPNTFLTVKVKANKKDAFVVAPWSETVSCSLLQAPIIKYNSGTFSWDIISNAEKYKFVVEELDGNKEIVETRSVDLNKGVFSLDVDFDKEGLYNAYVISLADKNANYVNSAPSNIVRVNKLSAPKSYKLSENMNAVDLNSQAIGSYLLNIEFQPIAGSNAYYQLLLDGTTVSTGSTKNSFSLIVPSSVEEKEHELEVKTMSFNEGNLLDNTLTLNSPNTLKIKLRKLVVPTGVRIGSTQDSDYNNTLVWDKNKDASAYSIFSGSLNQSLSNSFSMANYGNGRYTLRVSSRGELFDGAAKTYIASEVDEKTNFITGDTVVISSDFSNSIYVNKLETVNNISIKDNGGYLTWDAVNGADGYKILMNVHQKAAVSSSLDDAEVKTFNLCTKIEGETVTYTDIIKTSSARLLNLCYTDDGVNYKQYNLSPLGASFTIVAIGNHGVDLKSGEDITVDSEAASTATIFKLATPSGLTAKNTMLSWTAPSPAVNVRNYVVYDRDLMIGNTDTTEFSLANISEGKHYYKVVAEGDNVTYFTSDAAVLGHGITDEKGTYITKLPTMKTAIERVESSYRWKEIEGASAYSISLGLDTVKYYEITADKIAEDGYYYYQPNFENNLSPKLSFVVLGNNETSINSDAYTFDQKVRTLPTPQGENLIDIDMVGKNIRLSTSAVNEVDRGFIFWVDENKDGHDTTNNEGDRSALILSYDAIGEHLVRIALSGNFFDSDGVYCYESAPSEVAKTFKYLPDVNANSIQLKKISGTEYKILWDSLEGASYKYYYDIVDDNGNITYTCNGVNTVSTTSATIDLAAANVSGDINLNIYIMAIGNGSNLFASATYQMKNIGFSN